MSKNKAYEIYLNFKENIPQNSKVGYISIPKTYRVTCDIALSDEAVTRVNMREIVVMEY